MAGSWKNTGLLHAEKWGMVQACFFDQHVFRKSVSQLSNYQTVEKDERNRNQSNTAHMNAVDWFFKQEKCLAFRGVGEF